jgi:hypothetical protein
VLGIGEAVSMMGDHETTDRTDRRDMLSGKILVAGIVATVASCLAPPGYIGWGLAGLALGLLGWAGLRMRV